MISEITNKIVLDIRECKKDILRGLYCLHAKVSFYEERKRTLTPL